MRITSAVHGNVSARSLFPFSSSCVEYTRLCAFKREIDKVRGVVHHSRERRGGEGGFVQIEEEAMEIKAADNGKAKSKTKKK